MTIFKIDVTCSLPKVSQFQIIKKHDKITQLYTVCLYLKKDGLIYL